MMNFRKNVTVNNAAADAKSAAITSVSTIKADVKHATSNAASIFLLTLAVDAAVNVAQAIDKKFFK